jgi:hypothetical protein
MKIKCISNKLKINEHEIDEYEFLEIGRTYVVYGMIIDHGELKYYICDEVHSSFPISRPFSLFEIIDRNLSRCWIFGFVEGIEKFPSWNFREWIEEPYFQDNITDYEEREVSIFKYYKEFMDLEFPDTSISETAQIGNDQWLICPKCLDGWQNSEKRFALVRCPSCQTILNNPRYDEKIEQTQFKL